jgi:glycosyltransferase involved in cell wall biosynthesis
VVDISIVIACRNAAGTLGEALDSLVVQECGPDRTPDQPWAWEIVLADNGSTDGSRALFEAVAAAHPGIPMRVVPVPEPGKPHALNAAIRAAAGDRLLFCDADDRVAPGWLAAMARALETEPFVAARMDVRSMNPDWARIGRSVRQETGLDRLGHAPFCAMAGGATLGFHRRVFEAVGGFDPAFAALEDADFCIRAHLAGFRLAFVPDAVYLYRFRAEPAAIRRQAHAYARHRALLRRRYAPDARALAPGAWAGAAGTLGRLLAWRLGRAVLRLPPDAARRAWFSRELGRTTGDLAGALRHGVAPLRRSLPRAAPSPAPATGDATLEGIAPDGVAGT